MHEYRGCELPEERLYDLDHLWARPEGEGSFTLGITDPAQTMAGRVQYVFYKRPGTHRAAGKAVARLESGKWAGGIPAPFDGVVERTNPAIENDPGFVNVAPYTDAWLVVMRHNVQCMRCSE